MQIEPKPIVSYVKNMLTMFTFLFSMLAKSHYKSHKTFWWYNVTIKSVIIISHFIVFIEIQFFFEKTITKKNGKGSNYLLLIVNIRHPLKCVLKGNWILSSKYYVHFEKSHVGINLKLLLGYNKYDILLIHLCIYEIN